MSKQTVFENRFVLKQRLFSEGNQAAYAAHDRAREESVLLFLVPPSTKLAEDMDRAVRADIQRAFSVTSPSLLPVYDLREMGDYRFLVMPRPRGQNAWSLITQKKPGTKGLSPEQALRAADDLIAAAEAAHAQEHTILGCSPKQVWIDAHGGAEVQYYWLERAYLGGDEAVPVPAGGFKTLGVEGGYFRAPELEQGRAGAAPPADQFFIAAVLYGLLTGEVPSGTLAPIHRSRKDVPRSMAAAIEKGLAPNPSSRHRDLASMRGALHRKPARLTGLLPLLLLLLGLWAGRALFQGGADVDDFAFSEEIESRRAAAFAQSRPEARSVPTADEAALGRFTGRYVDSTDPKVSRTLALHPDGTFLVSDFTKDVPRHTRGLWWSDEADATGVVLRPVTANETQSAPWHARALDGALELRLEDGVEATLTKVGWHATRKDGRASEPLVEIDAPLVGAVLAELDVRVAGRVAVPRTRVTVNAATVPVVGTRFDTVVQAPSGDAFQVVVEATAPDGFRSRLARTVRIDREPPQIEVGAKLEQVEGIWRLAVEGRAADDGRLAALSVNDEPLSFDAEGRFAFERAGADAVAHAFAEVVAVDAAGRATRRLLWPAVVATNSVALAPQFEAVAAALEAGRTDAAEDLLRAIRQAGGLIEQLGPDKFARLARGDRPPRVSLDDYPRPPAYFTNDDGTREITLTGGVDWCGPDDVLMVGGRKIALDDARFEAKVQLPRLGPNKVPIQVLRAGDTIAKRDVEVLLAAGDGDVPSWTGVPVTREQREASARYGLEIGRENALGMRFVLVPPGAFFRRTAHGRRFEVRMTRPYYLQVGEVTRPQFKRHGARALTHVFTAKSGTISVDVADGPATDVTRAEAAAFARKVGDVEGGRYRLPTEAEWEHAARAGDVAGERYWGTDLSKVAAFANLADRSIKEVLPRWPDGLIAKEVDDGHAGPWRVRSGRANRWGLRDLLGNAAEWTADDYADYDPSAVENPRGAAGSRGVHRGGSFRDRPDGVGFSRRTPLGAGEKAANVGFRLLLEPEAP